METEKSVTKPTMLAIKVVKFLLLASVCMMALIFVARLIWRFSGANQWELVEERNGIRVYSLKAPGSDLQKFKGIVHVHSTLSDLVKMFQDPDICRESGCSETRMVERVDDQLQYYAFRYKLPFPFHAREFVVKEQFYQNPHTKEILVEVAASPDKSPPDDCCFRVTEVNNSWRFTPLENGEVEIEWVLNMNEGGFIPDLMLNRLRPKVMFAVLPKFQGWLHREKYQDAKFDFIKESGDVMTNVAGAHAAR
jgi:hypothetical protein